MEEYRCEARTVAGFIQQLAVGYVSRGYYRYVTGTIPERKDPRAVDQRLIEKFGIVDKRSRALRKQKGLANVVYLRYCYSFVLLVSDYGRSDEFEREGKLIRDIREVPLKFVGHSIGYGEGHVRVRIEQGLYEFLRWSFSKHALRLSREQIEVRFRKLRFEAFAPVRSQLLCILREVNRRRKLASLELVPTSCMRLYRQYPRAHLVSLLVPAVPHPQIADSRPQRALLLPRRMLTFDPLIVSPIDAEPGA